jgi:hypothetical protein
MLIGVSKVIVIAQLIQDLRRFDIVIFPLHLIISKDVFLHIFIQDLLKFSLIQAPKPFVKTNDLKVIWISFWLSLFFLAVVILRGLLLLLLRRLNLYRLGCHRRAASFGAGAGADVGLLHRGGVDFGGHT